MPEKEEGWWSWPGLNRRPRECHSRALPTAPQPHSEVDAITGLGSGQEIHEGLKMGKRV